MEEPLISLNDKIREISKLERNNENVRWLFYLLADRIRLLMKDLPLQKGKSGYYYFKCIRLAGNELEMIKSIYYKLFYSNPFYTIQPSDKDINDAIDWFYNVLINKVLCLESSKELDRIGGRYD
jgi:hypothetical protein